MAILQKVLCFRVLVVLVLWMVGAPACSGKEVVVAWDPSLDPNVIAHRIYYARSPDSVFTFVVEVADPVTRAVVRDLAKEAVYTFMATAVDSAGTESEFSEPVVVITGSGNDTPRLDALGGMVLRQNAGPQIVALTGVSSGEVAGTESVKLKASSTNPNLIPTPALTYLNPDTTGTLVFTPATNAIGVSIITVTVDDGQKTNNVSNQSFWVLVNNSPTLDPIPDRVIDKDDFAVLLTGISSGAPNELQTLTVTATSSNPGIVNPIVNYASPNSTGTLTFAPMLDAFGTATITVTVRDGEFGNNIVTRTFNVTVNLLPAISGLRAEPLDARRIQVTWNTDRYATCAVAYGSRPRTDRASASTYGMYHSVTLSNLEPATLYYLKVHATARKTATAAATAATDEPIVIQGPAENGILNESASVFASMDTENRKFVASRLTDESAAAALVTTFSAVPGRSEYRLWARVKTAPGGATFAVSIDGSEDQAVFASDMDATNSWHWALVMHDANRSSPFSAKGTQTLTVKGGPTAWWDEFLISNDPQWQPILQTTRPALTVVRDSEDMATLTWSDPSGNATSVQVEYSTDGINFRWHSSIPAAANMTTVMSLLPRTYYFRVFSYNSVDRTAYSNVAAAL